MSDGNWTQAQIAKLLRLGRMGESWGSIAQDVRHPALACERCWKLYASLADMDARLDVRTSRMHMPDRPVAPASGALPLDVQFPDDPRAVAECGEPRVMLARRNLQSLTGSAAAMVELWRL